MVIQVAKAEQEVALMADACRRAKEVCAMSTGNAVEEATRKLDMATANLKNAEEELKKTRSMRFQRQFSDDTSIEEEILDARSLHYSIKASPMSAITLRTDAREGALIEPDAAFFCFAYPMLPGYNWPLIESEYKGAKIRLEVENNRPSVLEIDGARYSTGQKVKRVEEHACIEISSWGKNLDGKPWKAVTIENGTIESVQEFFEGIVTVRLQQGGTVTFPNPAAAGAEPCTLPLCPTSYGSQSECPGRSCVCRE